MDLVLVLLLGVFGIAVYFFPTLVAFLGGKRNRGAILVLNLILGWTLLGWIGSLIWAIVAPREESQG
ncbi:MAG: superinfection immunity protein [Gammaproteobacteria bacterium]|nr:superinfection immunity protein [Gammaproteobacteria bacterium]